MSRWRLTFLRRCWVIASIAVICARIRAEVYITSTGMLLILFPASIASSMPFFVSGTSTQPVNRFFSFHEDSPCLISIRAASSKMKMSEITEGNLKLSNFTFRPQREYIRQDLFFFFLEEIKKCKTGAITGGNLRLIYFNSSLPQTPERHEWAMSTKIVHSIFCLCNTQRNIKITQ